MTTPFLLIGIGFLRMRKAVPYLSHEEMNAPKVSNILKSSEDRGAVGILEWLIIRRPQYIMAVHPHPAGLSREGIKLLCKHIPAILKRADETPPDLRDLREKAVALQSRDGTLQGQALCLTAPVVLRGIAKQRIIDRYRRKWKLCVKLIWVQQMLRHKTAGHLWRKASPIHTAEIVMGQSRQFSSGMITIVTGAPFLIPQHRSDCLRYRTGLFSPHLSKTVSAKSADIRECITAGIRERHQIHRGHGNHGIARRRTVICPVIRGIAIAKGVILAGIVNTVAFKAAITV